MTDGARLLEASVKVRRRSRHNRLNEEGLLAAALLVAPHDAEAPALVVSLLQDDVATPVHVAETRRHSMRITVPEGGGWREASTEERATWAARASESTAESS